MGSFKPVDTFLCFAPLILKYSGRFVAKQGERREEEAKAQRSQLWVLDEAGGSEDWEAWDFLSGSRVRSLVFCVRLQ